MLRAVDILHCGRPSSAAVRDPVRCAIWLGNRHGIAHPVASPHQVCSSRPSHVQPCLSNKTTITKRTRRSFTTMSQSRSWWRDPTPSPRRKSEETKFDSQPLDVPVESASEAEQLPTRRIHLLGLGSIGTLVAHSLKCLPNPPPITLLMHRAGMYETFKANGRTIRLINPKTQINDEQRGYAVDLLESNPETPSRRWRHIPDTPDVGIQAVDSITAAEKMETDEVYIYNLIVSVKGPATVEALASVKHRVGSNTTICLMQNGMGQIEELNQKVFTDPATRPTYMLGIVSHGAYMQTSFTVVHAGFGSTALGIWRDVDKFPLPPQTNIPDVQALSEEDQKKMYPSDADLYANLSSRYLLRTLTRSPVLTCAAYPYLDLMQLQLEKLAMNAVLNPLTALLDVPNGSILETEQLDRAQRLLLAEISLVIRSLPELEGIPGVNYRFSASRLENLLVAITNKTARNSSSMREDIRNLRLTEIEYINGYVVRRGDELGIKCVLNYLIMQLVQAKSIFTRPQSRLPYGISMIESENPDLGNVILEDKGTKIAGERY